MSLELQAAAPPTMRLSQGLARLLPYAFARQNQVLIAAEMDRPGGAVPVVWYCDATPVAALTEVARLLQRPLALERRPQAELSQAMARAYAQREDSAASVVENVEESIDLSRLMQDIPAVEDLLESEDDAPIIRMINALLTEAARENASDVHFEPFETHSVVRFRVDGVLRDVVRPKRELHAAIISRIKIMAVLDIAEKRLPQDGRMTLRVGGHPMDVRVSTLPTGHGERAVLRLLDKEAGRLDLHKLGMSAPVLATFDRLIQQPHGIVLITGPTGSGKTTTLYAALGRLDAGTTNIMTVEDPIEYDLPGIGQTQVNAKIDMSFARALRAILRQDPDVIMIGEIRDLETAQIAVQSSLTGHLVLATLHTNDAISAVTRLADMGVEPYLLASSLLGVGAQRLVRRLCPQCKAHDPVTSTWRPVGCPACNGSGYAGRTGIYELIPMDDDMRRIIHESRGGQLDEQALRAHVTTQGWPGMRDDGERWVQAGITSREEVLRATRD